MAGSPQQVSTEINHFFQQDFAESLMPRAECGQESETIESVTPSRLPLIVVLGPWHECEPFERKEQDNWAMLFGAIWLQPTRFQDRSPSGPLQVPSKTHSLGFLWDPRPRQAIQVRCTSTPLARSFFSRIALPYLGPGEREGLFFQMSDFAK